MLHPSWIRRRSGCLVPPSRQYILDHTEIYFEVFKYDKEATQERDVWSFLWLSAMNGQRSLIRGY